MYWFFDDRSAPYHLWHRGRPFLAVKKRGFANPHLSRLLNMLAEKRILGFQSRRVNNHIKRGCAMLAGTDHNETSMHFSC